MDLANVYFDQDLNLLTQTAGKMVGLILAHSVLIGNRLKAGELLVPLIIYYQEGIRKLEAFEAETQQEAVLRVQAFIAQIPDSVERWAYVQDGLITLNDGVKQDAYFIKAWVKGMQAPLELYQTYQLNPFMLVKTVKPINYEASGLPISEANLFTDAVNEGIVSHPLATREELQQCFGSSL